MSAKTANPARSGLSLNMAALKQQLLGLPSADARNLMDSMSDIQRHDLAEKLGLFTKQTRSDYNEW